MPPTPTPELQGKTPFESLDLDEKDYLPAAIEAPFPPAGGPRVRL